VITSRAAAGVQDLRAAGALLSRAWLDDAPFVASHPGDLEWWDALAAPDPLERHLRLWELDGSVTAWSWIRPDLVHWEIHPGSADPDGALLRAILGSAIAGSDGPLRAWAPEDDAATLDVLGRLGFEPTADRLSQFQRRVDRDPPLPDATPPPGYRIRSVTGPEEAATRMEVHRAAFAPSKLSLEQYQRLMRAPHYRPEDDLVAAAPDGTLAAFAMAWWDPVARVGEFEPVGTHPDHRRRGLGAAVLAQGLHRWRDLGAGRVQVYSWADNPASEALYASVGFRRVRYRRRFERPADRDVRSGP